MLLRVRQDVERTLIGFMGCQAALPALRLASHIVRAQRGARVLIVNLELCTIHLQETSALDSLLTFVLFADGCAASLVSAEPTGIELGTFKTAILPDCADQITWHIGNAGFRMWLDGAVPATIARGLPELMRGLPGGPGLAAIHASLEKVGLPRTAMAAAQPARRAMTRSAAVSPTMIEPPSEVSSRFRHRRIVLLPDPDGPTIATNTRFKYSNHGYGLVGSTFLCGFLSNGFGGFGFHQSCHFSGRYRLDRRLSG